MKIRAEKVKHGRRLGLSEANRKKAARRVSLIRPVPSEELPIRPEPEEEALDPTLAPPREPTENEVA